MESWESLAMYTNQQTFYMVVLSGHKFILVIRVKKYILDLARRLCDENVKFKLRKRTKLF